MANDMVMEMLDMKARPATVRFEVLPVEEPAASKKKGRYIARDVEFVWVKAQGGLDDVCYKVSRWLTQIE